MNFTLTISNKFK